MNILYSNKGSLPQAVDRQDIGVILGIDMHKLAYENLIYYPAYPQIHTTLTPGYHSLVKTGCSDFGKVDKILENSRSDPHGGTCL